MRMKAMQARIMTIQALTELECAPVNYHVCVDGITVFKELSGYTVWHDGAELFNLSRSDAKQEIIRSLKKG